MFVKIFAMQPLGVLCDASVDLRFFGCDDLLKNVQRGALIEVQGNYCCSRVLVVLIGMSEWWC